MKIIIKIETETDKTLIEKELKKWLIENFKNKAEVEIE